MNSPYRERQPLIKGNGSDYQSLPTLPAISRSPSIPLTPDPTTFGDDYNPEVIHLQTKLEMSSQIEDCLVRERHTLKCRLVTRDHHINYLNCKCHSLRTELNLIISQRDGALATVKKLRGQNISFLPLVQGLKQQLTTSKQQEQQRRNKNNERLMKLINIIRNNDSKDVNNVDGINDINDENKLLKILEIGLNNLISKDKQTDDIADLVLSPVVKSVLGTNSKNMGGGGSIQEENSRRRLTRKRPSSISKGVGKGDGDGDGDGNGAKEPIRKIGKFANTSNNNNNITPKRVLRCRTSNGRRIGETKEGQTK